MHLGFAVGPVDELTRIRIGEKVAWQGSASGRADLTINNPNLFGGEQKEGGVEGVACYLPGKSDQTLPPGLAARLGLSSAAAPAYRNIASIWFVGDVGGAASVGGAWEPGNTQYQAQIGGSVSDLTRRAARYAGFLWSKNSPFIQSIWATFKRIPKGFAPSLAAIGPDANPAHIIFEALTSEDFGKGDPISSVDTEGSFLDAAQTLYDEGFGLSLMWSGEGKIEDFIQEILDHIQALLYIDPRSGKWTLKLLRDDYDIGSAPTFDMTNAELLSYQKKAWGEIVNEIVVSWTNPETEKSETITVQNLAAIEAQGDVSSDPRDYYGVRNADLATRLAYRDLRQASAPLAVASIEVPRQFWTLPPGSVVRFDYPQHDLNGIVFRVMGIGRGSKKSKIRINLIEDIFSLARPALPAAPGTSWEDPSIDPPELATNTVFTLPYPLAARLGLAGVEDGFLYPEAVTAVLCHHESSEVTGIDLYAETVLPDGSERYEHIGTRQLCGYAVLTTAFTQEAETTYLDTPGVTTGRTPIEGGFALIGDGVDQESEIALVKARPEGGWILQRGAFDTVPRTWATGTSIWFFDAADMIADKSRIRGAGETARYKPLARTNRGTLDLGAVSPVSADVSDRAHRPHRPANIRVNGSAFGAVDIAAVDTISVTWSRRNRLTEDAAPPKWDGADVVPEAGQTTAIRLLDASGAVIKVWPEVPATSFSFPKSTLGSNDAAYIEVMSTRDGFASLQNWGAWLLDGAADPGTPPSIPDEDDVPPPNQGRVENPRARGANICPDPYFQDREFWNVASGEWQSVSRTGSQIVDELAVPKAAVLSDQWYSGSSSQSITSDLVVGLPRSGEALYFFARGKNDGSTPATLGAHFMRSDTDSQVGETVELTFEPGETDALGKKVAVPSGSDAVRFTLTSGVGSWVGQVAVSDVQLIEYANAADLEIEASLDAARDAINDALGAANEAFDEAAGQLAAVADTGARLSLKTWLRDPLLTGVEGWKAPGGVLQLVAGDPNALQAYWPFDGTGEQSDRVLIWPVNQPIAASRYVQAACEVGVLGPVAEVILKALWLDAAGNLISATEIDRGSEGRLEGITTAPAGAATVQIRCVPVVDEAVGGAFFIRRPQAAYALPGQQDVDPFAAPGDELMARIETLERLVGGTAEFQRNQLVENRDARAWTRERFLATVDLESAVALIDLTANATFEGVKNAVDGLPNGTILTEASARGIYLAKADLESAVALIDLTANSAFQSVKQTVDGLPDGELLTVAGAGFTFLAKSDLESALSNINLFTYSSITENTSKVIWSATTPPVGDYKEGDVWVRVNDKAWHVHDGSQWVLARDTGLVTTAFAGANYLTETSLQSALASVNFSALTFFGGIPAGADSWLEAFQDIEGRLLATYGFRLDVNGKIADMQALNDGTTSEIAFRFDAFKIYTGSADVQPFTFANGVLEGQNFVFDGGYIKDLTVDTLQIKDNAISQTASAAATSGTPQTSVTSSGGSVLVIASLYFQTLATAGQEHAIQRQIGSGSWVTIKSITGNPGNSLCLATVDQPGAAGQALRYRITSPTSTFLKELAFLQIVK